MYIIMHISLSNIPYSWKIWRGNKFGGLAVYITTAKLKFVKISYSHIILCMAILYQTAKFKSTNILGIAILGSIAKFNSYQYFQLFVIIIVQKMSVPFINCLL